MKQEVARYEVHRPFSGAPHGSKPGLLGRPHSTFAIVAHLPLPLNALQTSATCALGWLEFSNSSVLPLQPAGLRPANQAEPCDSHFRVMVVSGPLHSSGTGCIQVVLSALARPRTQDRAIKCRPRLDTTSSLCPATTTKLPVRVPAPKGPPKAARVRRQPGLTKTVPR